MDMLSYLLGKNNGGGTDTKYKPSYISFYQYPGNDLSNNLNGLDISNMSGTNNMFYGCSYITSLDLSGWDTSNIKYVGNTFRDCYSLASLNLSGWDTSNITEYSFMFWGCSSLETLDLSSFTTKNNARAVYMFNNCLGLSQLDMSNFDFTKLKDFNNMFDGMNQNCLIYVKDQTQVDWFTTNFPSLTNIQIKGA